MDVILMAAFGIEANPQDNPNSPVVLAAEQAMARSTSRQIFFTVLTILPFGLKVLEMFPSILLSNSMSLIKMAEEIISTKRAGNVNSSRKVIIQSTLSKADTFGAGINCLF